MTSQDHDGPLLRIGELADRTGVSTQALRYYERQGLLSPPRRLPSGYRAYPPEAVYAVRFIKHAQGLGFTLGEIAVLLRWTDSPDHCARVRELAMARIAETDRAITQLQAVRDSLRQMVAACAEPDPELPCPVSRAIDESTRWTIPLSQVDCPYLLTVSA